MTEWPVKLERAWSRFWFTPAPPLQLGISRILFYGLFFLFYLPWDFSGWGEVSRAFWMPIQLFERLHLPVFPAPTLSLMQVLWKASLLLACLGLFTRGSTLTAFLLGTYLLGLPHNFGKIHHFDTVVVLILGILAVSRCEAACSLDTLWRAHRGKKKAADHPAPPSAEYAWPVQMARVTISLAFFAAGVAKLRSSGLSWVTSDYLTLVLVEPQYQIFGLPPATGWGIFLAQFPWVGHLLAGMTLLIELGFPLALFFRWARWVFVPASIGMLIGIRLLLGPPFHQFVLAQVFWVPWERVVQRYNIRSIMMRRLLWVLLMVFLGVGLIGAVVRTDEKIRIKGRLELSNASGKVPLTVHVVGPNQLVRLGVGRPHKWVGCGMDVNWGDGPTAYVNECSEYLTHTYKTPGIFTVRAKIWHPGPDDSPVTDWEDTVKVTVLEPNGIQN